MGRKTLGRSTAPHIIGQYPSTTETTRSFTAGIRQEPYFALPFEIRLCVVELRPVEVYTLLGKLVSTNPLVDSAEMRSAWRISRLVCDDQ